MVAFSSVNILEPVPFHNGFYFSRCVSLFILLKKAFRQSPNFHAFSCRYIDIALDFHLYRAHFLRNLSSFTFQLTLTIQICTEKMHLGTPHCNVCLSSRILFSKNFISRSLLCRKLNSNCSL